VSDVERVWTLDVKYPVVALVIVGHLSKRYCPAGALAAILTLVAPLWLMRMSPFISRFLNIIGLAEAIVSVE
jgi:hypothetical protein